MTPDEFKARFGFEPRQDDVERAECPKAGTIGHAFCGVCPTHNSPRFFCGCTLWTVDKEEEDHG